MKVVAIIQARMGSTRLPGKILKKVKDKTLLEIQLERLNYSSLIHQIIVATTTLEQDDLIVNLCNQLNIDCYRGSEEDVLSRYYEAAMEFNANVIVRLTSDCPLIDPTIVDEVITSFIEQQDSIDYVSNTLVRTYPRGLDVEVFSFDALQRANDQANLQQDREHVTAYFYSNPDLFRIEHIKSNLDYSNFRWTVDTPEDLELIHRILNELYDDDNIFYMGDVLNLLTVHPKWREINAHIEQKKL
ncbi:cytidylyltransferase domain-containing protein [Psychrobacillus vulpis]|uniref:Acylneuraminate cytidylyltransferase n=1 Tax=Psychrobacillus vulpis TaxID=2325572 RepID=A0A544TIW8_9BACI|nr:glycosyltransferase family protein [Psychrobacillus vulpis]TQR17401.1 acylneuraminate cytidylyltransferase [Psychrobacillus vulpis]